MRAMLRVEEIAARLDRELDRCRYAHVQLLATTDIDPEAIESAIGELNGDSDSDSETEVETEADVRNNDSESDSGDTSNGSDDDIVIAPSPKRHDRHVAHSTTRPQKRARRT